MQVEGGFEDDLVQDFINKPTVPQWWQKPTRMPQKLGLDIQEIKYDLPQTNSKHALLPQTPKARHFERPSAPAELDLHLFALIVVGFDEPELGRFRV